MSQTDGTRHPQESSKANALLQRACLINGAEILCRSVPAPKIILDALEITDEVIDAWHREGLAAVVCPIGVIRPRDYHQEVFREVSAWNATIARHSDRLLRIDDADSFGRARNSSRVGVVICVHHAEHFRTVDDVDFFHSFGQRVTLLTSHAQNALGSPMNDRHDGGLSNFGAAVIRRMNEVGMAVDLSHCGERTTLEAIDASDRPIVMSHANAAGICPNPRNKSDEIIRNMAARGGVIGVMFLRMMVTALEPTTVDNIIDHVAYIADLVGPQHVGFGAEVPRVGYDAIDIAKTIPLPAYMRNEGTQRSLDIAETCSERRFEVLAEALLRRGFSESDALGVLGGNFRRVYGEIFAGARKSTAPVAV